MSKYRSKRPARVSLTKKNKTLRTKLALLLLIAVLALVCLAVRITQINASSSAEYKRIVLSNIQQQYQSNTIPFKRGDILDRNGTILATSEKVYNLILDCAVVNTQETDDDGEVTEPYKESTIKALVKMFDIKESDIRERLESDETKNSRYQIIKKNVTMDEKEAFEEYLEKEENEDIADVSVVWFEETYMRVYPQGSQACDLIGFANSSNEASWGIEGYYNQVLNGTNGRRFGYFDSDADVQQTIVDAQDGKTVVSTIDLNIQEIVREAIESFSETYKNGPNGTKAAENIAVIVMDPNSGEILAMDSSGWYDLNDPQDLTNAYDAKEIAAMTDEQKVEAMNSMWRNFCVSDAYEPGSTVKPFTVTAALDSSSISQTENFFCDGFQEINGVTIHCASWPEIHENLTAATALAYSCNDALMQIVGKTGASTFLKYLDLFGFGKKTGIDLPGETTGILYTEDNCGDIELATSAFGQGFTCNMIQEIAAFASIINGGSYYKPHVVKTIKDSSGNTVEEIESVVERRTCSKQTSDYIKTGLGLSTTIGTSIETKIDGYSMGGKTGTAQKLPRSDNNYLVSFIGFAPLDDPQVLVYVVVDEPNVEEQDNSIYAQFIARRIFTELFPYMGLYPDESTAVETTVSDDDDEEYDDEYDYDDYDDSYYEEELSTDFGSETGIDDVGVPEPLEEPVDETVLYGGNDLYSDGVDNDAQMLLE